MRRIILMAAGALLVACAKGDDDAVADSAAGAMVADSAAAGAARPADAGTGGAGMTDTTAGGQGAAAGTTGAAGDSAARDSNQSQSGVTDTRTGASTLGPNVTKTRPDQGQATTSKGDTVGRAGGRPPR